MKRILMLMALWFSLAPQALGDSLEWYPSSEIRPGYRYGDEPRACRVGWQWVEVDRWYEWEWAGARWRLVLVRQWQQQRVLRCRYATP